MYPFLQKLRYAQMSLQGSEELVLNGFKYFFHILPQLQLVVGQLFQVVRRQLRLLKVPRPLNQSSPVLRIKKLVSSADSMKQKHILFTKTDASSQESQKLTAC